MNVRARRLLEVAALPFPSPQGTQALVREQCEALARRGHEVHLLVYAHGDRRYEGPVVVHRLADWPAERSLRSGPSARKVVLDGRLVLEVRRLEAALGPDVVHAHNYEALAACLVARPRAPLLYHAHTLFGPELPCYASGPLGRAAARLCGELADRLLPPRADLTVAVSPRLERALAGLGHPPERLGLVEPGIALPGPAPEPGPARARLGLEAAEVVAYAGNLDRYQGLDLLLEAFALAARARPRLVLLVVTASDSGPLRRAAGRRGIEDRLRLVPHPDRLARVLEVLAAADLCVVPRSCPGGFPMKALAAMAAARPLVATEAGTAGLRLGEAALVVPDRAPRALAGAVSALLEAPGEALRRGLAGRRLVEERFTWDRASASLEAAFDRLAGPRRRAGRGGRPARRGRA